jgi:hypothetical protein
MRLVKEPTKKRLNELFEYKEGALYWKKKSHIKGPNNIGQRAGHIGGDGYRTIGVNGLSYKEHRLIWIFFNGAIKNGFEIDHKFRDKLDNRIENLRCGTHRNNQQNTSRYKNNSSGYKGVTFENRTKKPVAKIMANGKRIHLGTFNTVEEAATAYKIAATHYYGEFANYQK